MSDQAAKATKRVAKPKARKFYVMDPDYTLGGAPGYGIENETRLLMGQRDQGPEAVWLGPASCGQRGVAHFAGARPFPVDKNLARPPTVSEQFRGSWVISDRVEEGAGTVGPAGVAFVGCGGRLRGGEPGPAYWLCDV